MDKEEDFVRKFQLRILSMTLISECYFRAVLTCCFLQGMKNTGTYYTFISLQLSPKNDYYSGVSFLPMQEFKRTKPKNQLQ